MDWKTLTRGIKTSEFWLVIGFLILSTSGQFFNVPDVGNISSQLDKILTTLAQAIAIAIYIWGRIKYKVTHLEKTAEKIENVIKKENLPNDNESESKNKKDINPEVLNQILLEKVLNLFETNQLSDSLQKSKSKKTKRKKTDVLSEEEKNLINDLMEDRDIIDLL